MKKGTKFIIKMIISVVIALIGAIPSFIVGQNAGYSEGFGDGQISIQEETIEKLEGVKNIEGENINVYYNATLNDVMSESEDYKSLIAKLEDEKRTLESNVSRLESEMEEMRDYNTKLLNQLDYLSQESTVDSLSSGSTEATQSVKLLDVCPPYQYERYSTPTTIQIMGKTYSNGFQFSTSYSGYAFFNFEGKYKNLQFSLGHVDGSEMYDASFIIYLDDNYYTTINATAQMSITPITVPLGNISKMKIEFPQSDGFPVYGFVDAFLT